MKYSSKENRYDYFAPLIGNGRIATYIGPDGTGGCTAFSYEEEKRRRSCPTANIWWAGRRYIDVFTRDLIPFGNIRQSVSLKDRVFDFPTEWEQEFEPTDAAVTCVSDYTDDLKIVTRAFIHSDMDVLAVEKTFHGKRAEYEFCYCISDNPHSNSAPRGMKTVPHSEGSTVFFYYQIHGQQDYNGTVTVIADSLDGALPPETVYDGNSVRYKYSVKDGDRLFFYILLSDNAMGNEGLPTAEEMLSAVKKLGFEKLFSAHKEKWKSFYAEGYVKTGDESIDRVYETALYMLKCYTTPWSIPIGINDTHWGGRYFAFDEYYSFLGLLEGNHKELASRVPEFRFKGLDIAVTRASSKGLSEARFPWETVETGEEAAPPGFWYDHIFHMAHIAIGAWEYYEYTGDLNWLKEKGYKLIYSCSQFYVRHAVYNVGGRVFVGKFTDLERLGSSVENAFMTACAVIRTLEIASSAATLIGVDREYAEWCSVLAKSLRKNLPEENGAYVPYLGCDQKSIAVFTGVFPYRVTDKNDPRQEKAINEYLEQESIYGNMYAVGHGISTWYACWKAMLFARLFKSHETLDSLKQATKSAGCFAECFEINEKDCIYRPWFSTAGGIFISSVNEMVLQSKGNEIYILPSVTQEMDSVSFKLAAVGGIVISVKTVNNKLVYLKIENNGSLGEVTLKFPQFIDTSILGKNKTEFKLALEKSSLEFM